MLAAASRPYFLLHVLTHAVGYALLFFCTCSSLFTRCGPALFCHPSRSSGPQAKTPARRQSSVLDRASGFLSPASSSLVVFTQTADLRFRAVLAPRRRWLRVRQSRLRSAVPAPSSQCGALVCQRLALSRRAVRPSTC